MQSYGYFSLSILLMTAPSITFSIDPPSRGLVLPPFQPTVSTMSLQPLISSSRYWRYSNASKSWPIWKNWCPIYLVGASRICTMVSSGMSVGAPSVMIIIFIGFNFDFLSRKVSMQIVVRTSTDEGQPHGSIFSKMFRPCLGSLMLRYDFRWFRWWTVFMVSSARCGGNAIASPASFHKLPHIELASSIKKTYQIELTVHRDHCRPRGRLKWLPEIGGDSLWCTRRDRAWLISTGKEREKTKVRISKHRKNVPPSGKSSNRTVEGKNYWATLQSLLTWRPWLGVLQASCAVEGRVTLYTRMNRWLLPRAIDIYGCGCDLVERWMLYILSDFHLSISDQNPKNRDHDTWSAGATCGFSLIYSVSSIRALRLGRLGLCRKLLVCAAPPCLVVCSCWKGLDCFPWPRHDRYYL